MLAAERDRFLQFIPTPGFTAPEARRRTGWRVWRPKHDVVNTWIGIFDDAFGRNGRRSCSSSRPSSSAAGIRTYPQVSPRTLDIQVNWTGGMSFAALPDAWHPMVQAAAEEKRRMLRDPAWRSRARAEWDAVSWVMIPHKHPERIRLVSVSRPDPESWVGRTLADLVADRGGHPSDAARRLVARERPAARRRRCRRGQLRPRRRGRDARAPGGRHRQQRRGRPRPDDVRGAATPRSCSPATYATAEDLGLEAAVHALTGRQAELFGFAGRGVVAAGAHADLVVFDIDELRWEPDVMVGDLPGGSFRLRRPAGGYRWTVVAGTPTQEAGRSTTDLPGRVLRRSGIV